MKKRFIKRKKLGMALIFTLMVSVLAVAIASSYIGMTASSAKAARAYSKEAVALSTAQMGLDAVLNAMGNHTNWEWNGTYSCNRFKRKDNQNIYLNITSNANNNIISRTTTSNGATTHPTDGLQLYPRTNVELYGPTLGNNFLANITNASIPTVGNVFSTNNFYVKYGNERKKACLIIAVVPENVSAGGLHKGNVNYVIGVTSIIREDIAANGNIGNDTTFVSLLPNIIASRTLKMRVSNAYPGNAYQNVVAADYPNSGHADIPDFGYPNWEDLTADAAFLDENTVFDGGIRVDGASTSSNERWGAPQKTATWGDNNFSKSNYHSDSNGNLRGTKDSGLTDYLKSVYNSSGKFQAGYEEADTAGILKFSTLNKKFNKSGLDNYKYKTSTDTNKTRYLAEINKAASVNQKAVYYNLSDGTKVVNTDDSSWINEIASSNNSKFESGLKSTNIDSMWNFGNKPLMSAKDTSGTQGLYRQMASGKSKGCLNFTINDYQPDPMYANDTIEAPTVRITIKQQEDGDDYYEIKQVKYVADSSKPSGWREDTTKDLGSCSYTELKNNGVEGMIYVGGANVQVSGTASKSISIVSDVNPDIEKANAEAIANKGKSTDKMFDDRLTSPNVRSGDNYLYPDAQYNSSTGTWGLNSATSSATKKTLISGEKVANGETSSFAAGTSFTFPTYGEEQQPSGNITIIGDLKNADGTNPAIGLIAKNRVMLNDLNHKPQGAISQKEKPQYYSNTTNKNVPGKKDTYDSNVANVLTVKATVASETHNMCFDFNNISKNLDYVNEKSKNNSYTDENGKNHIDGKSYVANNYTKGAPGDYTGSVSNPTVATPASFQDCKTNYGMIVDENLAAKLTDSKNSTGTKWDKNAALIADDGKTNGGRFFFYKYSYLSDSAKKSIWTDTYMGAIRPDGVPSNRQIYTNGALDFNGMIISRFGDINADAGEPGTDVRLNQLGYVNQFMTFDSNTLDNCPPWFSMTNQDLNSYDSIIKWNIISYVDKGSFNGNN